MVLLSLHWGQTPVEGSVERNSLAVTHEGDWEWASTQLRLTREYVKAFGDYIERDRTGPQEVRTKNTATFMKLTT